MGEAYENAGEALMKEVASEQMYYLTRSVPLHEFCFFLEKPVMILLRNGNLLWTDAEFTCKIYGVHLVLPLLDVPVGKCWLIKRTDWTDGSSSLEVIDKDVKVDRVLR